MIHLPRPIKPAARIPRIRGRPRAIPSDLEREVLDMHDRGLGYRAISRELGHRDIRANYATVRRLIKSHKVPR